MKNSTATYSPTLIIGGGVGPMAGVELHRKIIEQTVTDGTDQDHFNVIHLSLPASIADRTGYLLGTDEINPGVQMAGVVGIAIRGMQTGQDQPEPLIVAGVPCNTFHAPPIFGAYREELQRISPSLKIVHMLEESIELIRTVQPSARRIGLMATTGTRTSGVWHSYLKNAGYEILEVDTETQSDLHETIYHPKWGLKAVSPASQQALDRFNSYAQNLIDKGAEALVLGCTEIPLALPGLSFMGTPLIDPMLALARAMVREGNPDKLRPV